MFTFTADSDNGASNLVDFGVDANKFETVGTAVGAGNMRNNVTFDFENSTDANSDGVYTFNVHASDVDLNNGPNMVVNITVDDVDEAPALSSVAVGSRNENLALGTLIYDARDYRTNTDNDGDGDAITYAITGGNTGNVFAMDAATGAITLAAPLDYETTTNYHLFFSGTSTTAPNAALIGDGDMTMTVGDVNEDPVITSNGGGNSATIHVDENTTAVTTVTTWLDAGETAEFRFDGASPDEAAFTLDVATGVLTFTAAPDFENPADANADGTYTVTLEVDDGTGNLDMQDLTIIVDDVTESSGHSSRAHSSHSADKVCKDSKATNFSNVGQHDQSLCKYAEEQKEEVKKEVRETVKEIVKETKEEVSKKCSVVTETKSLLRFGSKGQAVKDLQQYLNDNGFNAGTVDGIFGKLTKAAVKRMQAALGVTVDGIVGNQTRGKMSCE